LYGIAWPRTHRRSDVCPAAVVFAIGARFRRPFFSSNQKKTVFNDLSGHHHSSRIPVRNERAPDWSRSLLSLTPLMTPLVAIFAMLTAGLPSFGCLKTFVAVSSRRK